MSAIDTILNDAVEAIVALRRDGAAVHCITSTVVQNITANVLLACGATPSMSIAPEEIDHFLVGADAVLVNLGTLDDDRRTAARGAANSGRPFVLDPVFCHRAPPRLDFAREMLAADPVIIRANQREAEALAGEGACRVTTGEVDEVRTASTTIRIANGHPWMAAVTGIGCAEGAVMAALAAKAEPLAAAVAALVWFGVAGESAAAGSQGPGGFAAAFLDALHSISPKTLRNRARLS